MKQKLEGLIEQSSSYRGRYTELQTRDEHGFRVEHNLHDLLADYNGKNVRITIESLDEEPEEEDLVTVTYKELFKRCSGDDLSLMGVNVWYLSEGGDPTAIRDIKKMHALFFMSEEEFAGRCHSSVNA